MMEEILETIAGRISSYELLNNLLPGAIYMVAVERLTDLNVFSSDAFMNVILCYASGLIIGRIGSLVIEELLKKPQGGRWLGRIKYDEYVLAEKKDESGRLRLLSMTNNLYRSLVSTFICVLLTVCWSFIRPYIVSNAWGKMLCVVFGLIFVIILLCFAYRKQTRYVAKRAKVINSHSSKGEE